MDKSNNNEEYSINKLINELVPILSCNLCCKLLVPPVIVGITCAHQFCKKCLDGLPLIWAGNRCPVCFQEVVWHTATRLGDQMSEVVTRWRDRLNADIDEEQILHSKTKANKNKEYDVIDMVTRYTVGKTDQKDQPMEQKQNASEDSIDITQIPIALRHSIQQQEPIPNMEKTEENPSCYDDQNSNPNLSRTSYTEQYDLFKSQPLSFLSHPSPILKLPSQDQSSHLNDSFDWLQSQPFPTSSKLHHAITIPTTTQASILGIEHDIHATGRRISELLKARQEMKRKYDSSLPNITINDQSQQPNHSESQSVKDPQNYQTSEDSLAELPSVDIIRGADNLDLGGGYVVYLPIKVVAQYASLHSKECLETACNRGWISIGESTIDVDDQPKIMITDTQEETPGLTKRSVLYIKCLGLGFLITSFGWLKQSIEMDRLLDPRQYEIQGTVSDTVVGAPLRSRCLSRDHRGRLSLLTGYSFRLHCFNESEVVENKIQYTVSKADVQFIIELFGGRVNESQGMTIRSDGYYADLPCLDLCMQYLLPTRDNDRKLGQKNYRSQTE